jgi:hypothetical protein
VGVRPIINSPTTSFIYGEGIPSNLKEGCKGVEKRTSFMLGGENFFIGTASCLVNFSTELYWL